MGTSSLRLKHPIVLVHGLGARSAYGPFDYFHGLPARLRAAGNRVFVANLTPWHSIDHRAQQLKEQIGEAFPDPEMKLNLIGHSMGGLDSRCLTSKLGFAPRVASVTTIGTPNRGTTMGDIALGLVPSRAQAAVEKVLGLMSASSGGFQQITRKYHAETFSKECADAPGVAYFSATSAIVDPVFRTALPVFWVPHRVLKGTEGDNDGFVSVESAKWGHHICTYEGDHYGQIGQFLGRSRGLDYVKFFDEIFGTLRNEGF